MKLFIVQLKNYRKKISVPNFPNRLISQIPKFHLDRIKNQIEFSFKSGCLERFSLKLCDRLNSHIYLNCLNFILQMVFLWINYFVTP
jgi:hypothetical protein